MVNGADMRGHARTFYKIMNCQYIIIHRLVYLEISINYNFNTSVCILVLILLNTYRSITRKAHVTSGGFTTVTSHPKSGPLFIWNHKISKREPNFSKFFKKVTVLVTICYLGYRIGNKYVTFVTHWYF